MSKEDRKRWLRQLVCEGCSQHCRYANFRAHGKYAGGFAPPQDRDRAKEWERQKRRRAGEKLPHGNTGMKHDGQLMFSETQRALFTACPWPESWKYKRKGTVLGSMHETKMQMWEHYTQNCPLCGSEAEEIACQAEHQRSKS